MSSLENGLLSEYQLADEGVNRARLAGESFQKKKRHAAQVVAAASVPNVWLEGPPCKQQITDIHMNLIRFFRDSNHGGTLVYMILASDVNNKTSESSVFGGF
ncbi:hypothetical protein C5167_030468 [Papaver somniferum]|nr:hypothetical protein C5167_030468 [Papaver somniferum]